MVMVPIVIPLVLASLREGECSCLDPSQALWLYRVGAEDYVQRNALEEVADRRSGPRVHCPGRCVRFGRVPAPGMNS
jgi:hypothetical protein